MGGEGWGSEARKTKPFKNSRYKSGTLWDSLLENTQLVKKMMKQTGGQIKVWFQGDIRLSGLQKKCLIRGELKKVWY